MPRTKKRKNNGDSSKPNFVEKKIKNDEPTERVSLAENQRGTDDNKTETRQNEERDNDLSSIPASGDKQAANSFGSIPKDEFSNENCCVTEQENKYETNEKERIELPKVWSNVTLL